MDFTIRDYRAEDEEAVLRLLQVGMGGGPTGMREKSFWRWKHHDNPFGRSISLVAEASGGELIGLRTFMRWGFRAGDADIGAVRAVDTVTHPEYRRYGVFSRLTSAAVERVRADGVDFIFNTPNAQVLPGYLKLGWKYVSLVRPLVRVINYPRFINAFLARRARDRSSAQLAAAEVFTKGLPGMADFLKGCRNIEELIKSNNELRDGRISTRQSREYLAWRYSGHHFGDYRVLGYEKDGAVRGCAVLRPSTRFGLKEVVVVELLLSSTVEETAMVLLKELKRCVNADYLIAFFPEGSFQRRMLHRHGFHRVPRQGQNFTVKLFNTGLPGDPLSFANWDLSLGDLEVF